MVQRILTPEEGDLLVAERRKLSDLRVALTKLDLTPEDAITLEASLAQLDDLFLLVVVGEFNAGKSAFINALLGERLLEEGVTPTTSRIQLLRYGPAHSRRDSGDGQHLELELPVDLLREIVIVDTPGTNAIYREHEALTQQFVPRSDIVLFVTSVDRPFTESERLFLGLIRDWGKKVVFVANKMDILESTAELESIRSFVAEHAKEVLGVEPEVFAVSARRALRAKESGDAQALQESGFAALEEYLTARLNEKERLRLKLHSPLGVAGHLVEKYLTEADRELALLKDDVDAINEVARQQETYKADMRREFQARLAEIDNVLYALESRGLVFFDETVRLGRVIDLLNVKGTQSDFERKVVADTPQVLDQRINEMIDWLVAGNLRQWQSISEYLALRRAKYSDRLIGTIGNFDYDRSRLLDSVGRSAQDVIQNYDQSDEARRIAESAQGAVAGTAITEIGAIGLGTAITMLATTSMADVTGIAAAGMVAALGLFIIPARRAKAKEQLSKRLAELRGELSSTLHREFDQAIERDVRRISEAISPYTRFVRTEQGRLTEARQELGDIQSALNHLRVRVDAL